MMNDELRIQVDEAVEARLPRDFYRVFERLEPNLSSLTPADAGRLREATSRMFNMTTVGLDEHDRATMGRLRRWWEQPNEGNREIKRGFSAVIAGLFGRR
ncbi:MAG: hypothetical protein AAB473_00400 [Patescibacteria group bacterium]